MRLLRCEAARGFARLFVFAAAALPALAGCGAHDHRDLGTTAVPGTWAARAPQAGPRVLAEPLRSLEVVPDTRSRAVPPAHAEALQAGLFEALVATGSFDRVTSDPMRELSALEWTREPIEPRAKGAASGPANPRLKLELALESCEADDLGTSAGPVIGYLFLGPWTDWWHDVPCRLEASFSAVLRDGESGKVLARLPSLKGRAVEEMSFFERRGGAGPTVATFFWIPPMAFDSDPDKVTTSLAARAMEDPARAIVAAVAQVKTRALEATYSKVFPQEGLKVEVTQPRAGPPKVFTTVGLKLSGEKLAKVRTVWIGDQVVFDATKRPLAQGATEAVVGRPITDLEQGGGPLLVFAQLANGDPPFAIAEVGVARRTEMAPAGSMK